MTEFNKAEQDAINSLKRLAKKWPQTLKLMSMAGLLYVIHSNNSYEFVNSGGENSEHIQGIPCDGGDF
ncbi:hypothetical protein [Dyadobacter bucti]|uniref:hypothetical protein n=1 Tax=Dyadobacter bucti TaxID=2572203 RepID=UPI0011098D85|nr:hypothetical protein [Dyadobacter bucti]